MSIVNIWTCIQFVQCCGWSGAEVWYCVYCVVPSCDLVFGSHLLFFVLSQTPDCYLSSGRESENMRDDEGRRCMCVCFCACLCMHLPVCMLRGGGGGLLCSHSSDSALVTGWRGWWKGRVGERRGENIEVKRWGRSRHSRWVVCVCEEEENSVCWWRKKQRMTNEGEGGGWRRKETKADTDFSLCSIIWTVTHSWFRPV